MSILWHIWKARNNTIFRQQQPNPKQVAQSTLANTRSSQCANGTSLLVPMLPWPVCVEIPPAS